MPSEIVSKFTLGPPDLKATPAYLGGDRLGGHPLDECSVWKIKDVSSRAIGRNLRSLELCTRAASLVLDDPG